MKLQTQLDPRWGDKHILFMSLVRARFHGHRDPRKGRLRDRGQAWDDFFDSLKDVLLRESQITPNTTDKT